MVKEKENTEFKPVVPHLKFDFVSYHAKGVSKYKQDDFMDSRCCCLIKPQSNTEWKGKTVKISGLC